MAKNGKTKRDQAIEELKAMRGVKLHEAIERELEARELRAQVSSLEAAIDAVDGILQRKGGEGAE